MRVFIAGGTSGMGWALAQKYLADGDIVAVCGRDIARVTQPEQFDNLYLYEGDVCNSFFIDSAIDDFAKEGLDLFVIAVGAYTDNSLQQISYEDSMQMMQVNVVATTNMIFYVQKIMYQQKNKGQIAVIASVSGLLNYPQATIYSKSKRSLIYIVEAFRSALKDFGITFTIIAPGYVSTPKLKEYNNDDLSRKPFVVDTDYAASMIHEGIKSKKEIIIFPKRMKYLMKFLSYLPDSLLNFIMKRKTLWMNKDK